MSTNLERAKRLANWIRAKVAAAGQAQLLAAAALNQVPANPIIMNAANAGAVIAGAANAGAANANAGNQAANQGGGNLPPITPPAHGGVKHFHNYNVAWTSGAPQGTPGSHNTPATHAALCPRDSYKDAMKMEESCQFAPPAAKLLGLPDHKNDTGISLTGWVSVISMHIRNCAMDLVFYIRKSLATTTFTDLLEEWNQYSNDEIHKWLEDESAGFDEYNEENL